MRLPTDRIRRIIQLAAAAGVPDYELRPGVKQLVDIETLPVQQPRLLAAASKAARIQRAYMQARGSVTVSILAERFNCSRYTVYRAVAHVRNSTGVEPMQVIPKLPKEPV